MRAVLFLLFLFLLPSVLGLGVAQEYHEGNTLKLNPGERYEHKINIQNEEEREVKVNLTVSHDWVALPAGKSELITIAPKTYNTQRFLVIDVPEEAEIGTRVTARFSAQPLAADDGQVNMGIRINDKFDVLVVAEEPQEEDPGALGSDNQWWRYVLLVVLVGSVIAVLYMQSARISRAMVRQPRVPKGAFVINGSYARSPEEAALLLHEAPTDLRWEELAPALAEWVYSRSRNERHYHLVASARTKESLIKTLLFDL